MLQSVVSPPENALKLEKIVQIFVNNKYVIFVHFFVSFF